MSGSKDGWLVDGWVLWQKRRNLVASTRRRRQAEILKLARWLAPRTLLEAEPCDIQAWLDTRPITPRTRYSYLSFVSSFYGWATDEGHILANPVDRVPRPRRPRGVPRPISDADLAMALALADQRMRALLLCAALAGLRCQEIAGLQREDVLERNRPPVIVVTHGKGDKERVVPLHPDLWRALRAVMPRSGCVFPTQDGHPMHPVSMSNLINRCLHDLGIADTAHSLRHYFGTSMLRAAKGDLRIVQETMGHSSPNSTALYTAYSVTDAFMAVEGIQVEELTGRRGPDDG